MGEGDNSFWGEMWDTDNKNKLDSEVILELREHPFTKNILKSSLVLLAILGTSVLAGYFMENFLVSVFVFVFLVISNTSFFFPSVYIFSKDKFTVDRIIYKKSYPWKRFKSFVLDKNGVYLSPLKDASNFDRFRGVFLVMGCKNREKLKPLLEEKINVSSLLRGGDVPRGDG